MTRSLLAVALLCLSVDGFALQGSDYASTVVSTTTEEDRTVVTLQDSSNRTFIVAYLDEPASDTGKKVVQLKDLFFSWKNITINSLRFTITEGIVDALVVPGKILVDGRDVRSFVPAGLLFSFSGNLAYDFRVTRDNLFLRVRGTYTNEQEMTQKIAAALANPSLFLQRSDTEYVLSRVEKDDQDIEALTTSLKTLADKYEALSAENEKLRGEVDAFRYAAMRRENVEWLFLRTPIPRDGLARVRQLKQETPSLTRSEVEAQLKKEGIKVSAEAVTIIFEYYFNEF
jgi:hypothetical protein